MKTIENVDVYVRFCETDAGGHVSNTSYFLYLEEARTKFFTAIHYGQRERQNHVNFILARTECNFIAQSFAGQTLTVQSSLTNIGTKSFTINHEIYEQNSGKLIATGVAVVVCFDFLEQKSVEISDELRSILSQYVIKTPIHEVSRSEEENT